MNIQELEQIKKDFVQSDAKRTSLQNEINILNKQLKEYEEKEIQMEKMQFIQKAKDEYSMLVGKPEEIAETLYAISKSSLSEETQQFILDKEAFVFARTIN